ncbi:hypothetical protein [Amantichitinum ursilacus]|uniref:PsiF repeat protein n=1 Tax=Amantichitinum ursilacus TaxID=857265 RepID=A0A0N0GQ06_9NEIS|nr:hypothetical protein [Amantichitinum ursilacus]KPC54284.1 hypothetical protein WG78_06530 [Amantichitinum ursilacus]
MKKVTSLLCLLSATLLIGSGMAYADDAADATTPTPKASKHKSSEAKAAARKEAKANSKEVMDKFATLPKSEYPAACKDLSAQIKAGKKGLNEAYNTYCMKSPT